MAHFLIAMVALFVVYAAFQMLLLALVVGGLIFRPKETTGLLMIGGLIHLCQVHPNIGLGLVGLLIVAAIIKAKRSDPPPPEQPKLLE